MAEFSFRSPEFDSLRKQARRWQKALRSGDAEARRRLDAVLPHHAEPPVLREVQQALARERGFASWAALKEQCAAEAEARAGQRALLDVFLEHACIFTPPLDLPAKWQRAERIRARHPEIATASAHAAAVCGEVEALRRLLDEEPSRLAEPGGPQAWPPLLYACYGRLPDEQARSRSLEVAELLLEAGADPDSFFVTEDDWRLRFSALCGAMGQGEMGQPEHPQAEALARALLERGADPNEGQGLYNTHLVGDDTRWLELLMEYGFGPEAPVRWHADPGNAHRSGADHYPTMFHYLVCQAAAHGHLGRLRLLLDRGADPAATSHYDGLSCAQRALRNGHLEAHALLVEYGAAPAVLEGHDAFVAAVRLGDEEEAARLIRDHPEWRGIGDPLTEAAGRGEMQVVRRLLELGVDPNAESQHGHRALNNASCHREMSELLLAHGADPRARAFGGTASAWARNSGDPDMARFQAERSRSLLDAVHSGHVSLARELLEADPACLGERDPEGSGALHLVTNEVEAAEALIAMLLACGADPDLRNDAGETPAEHLEEAGADLVADLLEAMRGG